MNDDPFIEKEVKWKDRINIETLEDTTILQFKKSFLSAAVEEKIRKMKAILQKPIHIEDSPNQLIPGKQITEWVVQAGEKFVLLPNNIYFQVGGRAFINKRICEQGALRNFEKETEVLAIDKLTFIHIEYIMTNLLNKVDD